MADLFRSSATASAGQAQGSNTGSPAARDPEVLSDNGDDEAVHDGGTYRRDTRARVVGTRIEGPKKGLFKYDVVRGRGANVQFAATRDDRMSIAEASDRLHVMHDMFDMANENEEILYAFDRALFFCHTLNSGSTLVPGRSSFSIPQVGSVDFDFGRVRDYLGNDVRRFFRAYADFTTQVNKQVIAEYTRNPVDSVVAENYGLLVQIAADRNLHRFPYLAHDSADACLELTLSERLAVSQSKTMVIGATPNAVDGARPHAAIKSAEGLDSTTGRIY